MVGGRALGALAGVVLAACGGEDPDSALARLLEEAETAVEQRDAGFFRGVVSERYMDARGNDRDRLLGMIRGYFLSHEAIEVITRLDSVTINAGNAAELVVFAGLVGHRAGATILEGYDGRLYRVQMEFVEEHGDWRIIGARWERSAEAAAGE